MSTEPEGADVLDDIAIHDLIASGIPASSYAVGANEVEIFINDISNNNFNMMTDDFRSHDFGDWKHSDIKDKPPVYTIKVFQKMINLGNLNQE